MKYNKNGTPKDISNIQAFKGGIIRSISNVYSYIGNKLVLVWSIAQDIISSVFGSGVWRNDEAWNNEDVWKNEP